MIRIELGFPDDGATEARGVTASGQATVLRSAHIRPAFFSPTDQPIFLNLEVVVELVNEGGAKNKVTTHQVALVISGTTGKISLRNRTRPTGQTALESKILKGTSSVIVGDAKVLLDGLEDEDDGQEEDQESEGDE